MNILASPTIYNQAICNFPFNVTNGTHENNFCTQIDDATKCGINSTHYDECKLG